VLAVVAVVAPARGEIESSHNINPQALAVKTLAAVVVVAYTTLKEPTKLHPFHI
jgi:hypothetical protein